jgi:hypothetical protein
VDSLPREIAREALSFPGIRDLIASGPIEDKRLAALLA